MSVSPAVSVIVPIYKVEAYLPRCLQSLRAQTFPDIEIILVDDGSPDGCPAICDAAAADDGRIRVIHQENAGLSAARNVGIEQASAPWLMFVDSDDAVRPTFCARALELVQTSGADIAVFDFERFNFDGSSIVPEKRHLSSGLYDKEEALAALAHGDILDYAWNKIYRRELFDDVRYPVGEIWEDMGTTYLLFAAAEKIFLSHDVLYEYHLRQGSVSMYALRDATADILHQREKEYAFLRENYPRAAKAMEALITGVELDFCMYRCLDPGDRKCREVRRRLLSRRIGLRELGWKMWVKVKSLHFPPLFWLVTWRRRRRTRAFGGSNGNEDR